MDIFDSKGIVPMLIIRCVAYCDKDGVDIRNKRNFKLLPRFPAMQIATL